MTLQIVAHSLQVVQVQLFDFLRGLFVVVVVKEGRQPLRGF